MDKRAGHGTHSIAVEVSLGHHVRRLFRRQFDVASLERTHKLVWRYATLAVAVKEIKNAPVSSALHLRELGDIVFDGASRFGQEERDSLRLRAGNAREGESVENTMAGRKKALRGTEAFAGRCNADEQPATTTAVPSSGGRTWNRCC